MRSGFQGLFATAAIAACIGSLPVHAAAKTTAAAQTQCKGGFSNGASINIASPVNEIEVGWVPAAHYGQKPPYPAIPGNAVTSCDVHTFAWNQFLYLTATDPATHNARFMGMAPWYNVLMTNGSPAPTAYPGGSTALETAMLDQGQAGDDDHLLDVAGNTVRYDIRFNATMYGGIVAGQVYTQDLFKQQCQPLANGICATENSQKFGTKVWLPPQFANEGPEQGSVEVKTAWRDFGAPGKCPSDYFCQGRFGLVGLHYVNKTFYHGEWIWATFEHVANDPDCNPGGDEPIAQTSPTGVAWAFFNPKTVPPSVMTTKVCSTTSASQQCNGSPKSGSTWIPVNVCRTISAAAGGASTANCAVQAGVPNVPGNISCLNATVMPQLAGPWKNYKLVGALWVMNGMSFMQDFYVVGFQTPISGFTPATPVGIPFLANTTMETWFQHNSAFHSPNAVAANGGTADSGCFLCHNLPSAYGTHNRQMDLSHFPGKLPAAKLMALKASLIPANSSAAAPK